MLAQVEQRIAQTDEIVQKFNEALQLAQKAKQEIASKSYFYAIKSLKTIKTEFLSIPPLVTLKFTDKFLVWIRETLKEIQIASFKSFREWMQKIDDEYLEQMGNFAIRLTSKRIRSNGSQSKSLSGLNHPLDWILDEKEPDVSGQDDFEALSDKINLSIVFETLYAHSLLDQKDVFTKSYLQLRSEKFQLLLDEFQQEPVPNILSHFDAALTRIAGYFIFESLVLSNSQGSFSKSSVESQWISFLSHFYEKSQRLIDVVLPQLADHSHDEPFISFRNTCNCFIQCMSAYQYKFEGISALFTDLIQKFISLQRTFYSKRTFSILQGQQLREQLKITDPALLQQYSFLAAAIRESQSFSLLLKTINLVKKATQESYEFNFSSVAINIYGILSEFSQKLKGFIAELPLETNQLLLKAVDSFIADEVAAPIVVLCQDRKSDFELLKTLLHTIDALSYPIRQEIVAYFGADSANTEPFLHSQSSSIQQELLKRLQLSIADLFPLQPEHEKDFFEYLRSIYNEKLVDLAVDRKQLLFWNVLNFVAQRLSDSFYKDTSKGPIEGPSAPILQRYRGLLVQMRAFCEENFPSNPDEYQTLFASLRQPLECIENGAFYDLTTVTGRSERFGQIDLRRFVQTLDALRTSSWASKTPFAANPKLTVKSVIEDVIKKIKTEFRF